MPEAQYRKDWLATSTIARSLLTLEEDGRIPTIEEYIRLTGCSRGLVQNALQALQQAGAIRLDKRGKKGSYLAAKREDRLFDAAGLQFFTGSMPAPLNMYLAGLATGVCQAMGRCAVPFTFAFVQGAQTRTDALRRQVYDFVIVSHSAAKEQLARHPELQFAFSLYGCKYSQPYALYLNRPGCTAVQDGMRVAADPASTDQWELTARLCAGRKVEFVEMPYVSTGLAFFAGQVDCVVHRNALMADDLRMASLLPLAGPADIDPGQISIVPLREDAAGERQLPVVLVHGANYGMGDILQKYLDGAFIAPIQRRVINHQMAPRFY